MAMYNEITVTAELTNTEYMITKNYNLLQNKPQINSVELMGNKSLEDLGINPDAEENVIDVVKVNGSALTPDANKAVNVTVTTGSDNGTVKVNGSDVAVKGLKSAAFTAATAYDAAGSAAEVQGNVDALTAVVNGKVDKVQGKGLSQNDFTNAYKTKLDGIEAGAQVNTVTSVAGKTGAVNLSKSNVGLGNVDNTSDLNKPISTATQTALDGKVDKVEGKGLSTEDFTAEEKTKLAGIEDGAEVNVQADWNQTDVNADDYIKNKPEIGDAAYAEHLALTTPINNNAPYLFRAFPVRNAFKENLKSIVGGTVAFNQLVQNGNFVNTSNWYTINASFSVSDNVGTLTASAYKGFVRQQIDLVNGRKYLVKFSVKPSTATDKIHCGLLINNGSSFSGDVFTASNTNWQDFSIIANPTISSGSNFIIFRDERNENWDSVLIKNVNLIDLTQIFGSTIADYIYSLEQATAGSGVAYFRSLFPKDYYDYNAGQLMSVKALSHKMVGFNAFNVTTGKAKLLGGNQYQITGTYTALSYSTGETLTPDSNGKFTPSASGELTVTGGDNTTCVHLVWDGKRDGEYEAYSEHIYPLDSDLELRGIPKLDSNNNLYYDGDTYESDGTVTRKYAVVDLGTLDWTYDNNNSRFVTQINELKRYNANRITPFICDKYVGIYDGRALADVTDKSVYGASNSVNVFIKDTSYTDATTFKTAMSGVYLVYELATPTTETADTFQSLQIVDDFGTEEFVDNRDVSIPVGNDTDFTQEIHIASLPTADGTYNATLTMSNGIATMSFVSTS